MEDARRPVNNDLAFRRLDLASPGAGEAMVSRLLQSLRRQGLAGTIRSARRHLAIGVSRLADRHFDWAFGTETSRVVENAALGDVTSPNLARGIRYEPTRALPLRRVLRAARIPTQGTFVDIGCGKGRACMIAAMHGFGYVVGIDYSRQLCRIAERNLELFRARTGRRFRSHIHAMDAADYAFTRDDTVLYLYNPFDAGVLAAVLARLAMSLVAHPRPVWIVYHNPLWRDAIERGGAFTHMGDWSFGGCEFAVYRSAAIVEGGS